jgi:hypothetical protein
MAACKKCTRDDKKIILQLKMMQALLDGRPEEAFKFSSALNRYLHQPKKPTEPAVKKKHKKEKKPAPLPYDLDLGLEEGE